MQTQYENWLRYWKNSLADAQRLSIDLDRATTAILPFSDLDEGQLVQAKIEKLFEEEEKKRNKDKGITDPRSKDWEILKEVGVLISLMAVTPRPEYLQFVTQKQPVHPFWIAARLMREGVLKAPENIFPLIAREYLMPMGNDQQEYIFSSVDKVDDAASLRQDEVKTWKQYIAYVENVFKILTEETFTSYQAEEGFVATFELTMLVKDEDQNAAQAIIKLYEHLIAEKQLPSLLKSFITVDCPKDVIPVQAPQYIAEHTQHLGQMSNSFPLSITQRKSLYSFNHYEESNVLAVNGPPGTGKTTLLQSMVANAIVLSALEGKEPPLILACSTNNQAVTNINESFSKAESSLKDLSGRWIPDFSGYATFLPSVSKTEDELKGINYLKTDKSGTFKNLENTEYVTKAKEFFLQKAKNYFQKNYLKVQEVTKALQEQIKNIKDTLEKGTYHWNTLQTLQKGLSTKITPSHLEDQNLDEVQFWSDFKSHLQTQEERVIYYFDTEPFWRRLFCYFNFKGFKQDRELALRRLFVESYIEKSLLKFDGSKLELLQWLHHTIEETIKIQEAISKWKKWKEENHIKNNPPKDEKEMWEKEYEKLGANDARPNYYFDEIDLLHRHQAFQLAVHYWEGRWLEKMDEDLRGGRKMSNGENDTKEMWKIRAMLTPCFVSTFFMAPKFFSYWKHLGKRDDNTSIWSSPPIKDFIDLLIVDESGQVSPEVGVAIFALAKKAIVVGDIKQIEPVWNISPRIDIGNLVKFALLKNEKDDLQHNLVNKGFLASCGSIMKMAQNSCPFVDPENATRERGLILTEHRRCNNEIIEYCNELAYAGMLKPMKGKASIDQLFPSMVLIHVEGQSIVKNKDRSNVTEADFVIKWLQSNRANIEAKFANPKKEKYPQIEELVGIVTPFKGQKRLLVQKLGQAGFSVSKMKVGTVHALQGAEKEIVLFSTVYGEGDTGTMFFDRDNKPNMLNVAVSRAKQSFIVIGNERIFNHKSNTPSGILRRYLQK